MIEEIKIDQLEELIQEMMKKIRDTYPTESREGNPITFDNGAAAPLVKCVTEIQGSQSGSGTPSSDNVRPIVGYTEGKIEVSNANPCNNFAFTVDAYINDLGVVTPNPMYKYVTDLIKVEPLTTYTIQLYKQSPTELAVSVPMYDANHSFIYRETAISLTTETGILTGTFTTTEDTHYIRFSTPKESSEHRIYNTAYTTSYSSAIFRGSEDVVRGEVVTEWGMIASYDGENLPGKWISDRDEYAPGTTPTTGAQVAYELATPTTASLAVSKSPITSLSGYNHIESATGEMKIEYVKEMFQGIVDLIPQIKVNSSGEATATLSKLEVDDVIYGLPE